MSSSRLYVMTLLKRHGPMHGHRMRLTAQQDRLDGLTVDLGEWWFNLRPSNTEPLLRLNLEAASPADVETHVAELRSIIEKGS